MSYLSEILADSPSGVWFLDEASGTTATDQSGNSRSGTYTGSNTKRGGQLVLSEQNAVDLTGGYVDIADNNAWSPEIGASGAITIECWFVADTLSGAEMLVTKHLEYNLRLEANGSITWFVNNATSGAIMETDSAAAAVVTGTLYHLVAVYDRSTPKIETYKNGASINSSTTVIGSPPSNNSNNLQIGHRSDSNGTVFDGRIGFVAIYPTALSSGRISAHYNAGRASAFIGQALETDSGGHVGVVVPQVIGQATETDTAGAVQIITPVIIGQAMETDTAAPVALATGWTIGQAVETDSAAAVVVEAAIDIMPVYRDPVLYGPFTIDQPDVFVAELTTTLHPRDAPLAFIGELELAFARQFRDDLNDAGAAQLSLNSEDPIISTVNEEMIVRFNIRGIPVFDAFLEQIALSTLVQGEEHDQIRAYQGRGKICILEEGLVYPSLGLGVTPVEDDRTFDWTWNSYDDSAWGHATELCTVAFAQTDWPQPGTPRFADGWINTDEMVLWSDDGTYLNALPPAGMTGADALSTNYFRHVFLATTPGVYRIDTVFDNYGAFYMDGVRPPPTIVSSGDGFTHKQSADVILTAGPHLFSAVASNVSAAVTYNPGALVYDISPVNGDNTVTAGTSVLRSDSGALILQRQTTPPGVTIGLILRTLITEAQFRGAIPEVTLAFNDNIDSLGQSWVTTNLVSTKVGTDLLTFLKELSATYIDFWMPPGDFVLYAAAKGTRGSTKAVSLGGPTDPTDARSGNVTNLTHKRTV